VTSSGTSVIVDLPTGSQTSQLLSYLTSPGQLQFRPVELDTSGQELIYAGSGGSGPPLTSAAALADPAATGNPVVLPQELNGAVTARFVLGPVLRDGGYLFDNRVLASAEAANDQSGQWLVNVTFSPAGGAEWDKVVGGQYYQKYIGIVIDGVVISAPQINAQQFDGQATISGGSGGFTQSQATQLAGALQSGALPITLTESAPTTFTVVGSSGSSAIGLGARIEFTAGNVPSVAEQAVTLLRSDHASFDVLTLTGAGGQRVVVEVFGASSSRVTQLEAQLASRTGTPTTGMVVTTITPVSAAQPPPSPATAPPATQTLPPTTVPAAAPIVAPVPPGKSIAGPTPCPAADGSSPRASHFSAPPPPCITPTGKYTATFETTQGNIVVALDTTSTPLTTNNFVVLSRYHYYDGSSFDRIDTSIDIIQGGSPGTQTIADPGPGYTIPDEPAANFTTDAQGNLHGPYTYAPGDLAMARGSAANSGAAQFFFVVGPNAAALNGQGTYVVFGHVTQGLEILQRIETQLYRPCPPTDQTCLGGYPNPPVIVRAVTISQ